MSESFTSPLELSDLQTVADSFNALSPTFDSVNSFSDDSFSAEYYHNIPSNNEVTSADTIFDFDKYLDTLLNENIPSPTLTDASLSSPTSVYSTTSTISVDDLLNFSLADSDADMEQSTVHPPEDSNKTQVYCDLLNSLINGGFPSLVRSDTNTCCGSDHSLGFCNVYGEFDFTLFPKDESLNNLPTYLITDDSESEVAMPPSPSSSCGFSSSPIPSEFTSSPVPSLTSSSDLDGSFTIGEPARQVEQRKPYSRPLCVPGFDLSKIRKGSNGKFKCPFENCNSTHARRFNLKTHFEAKHCKLKPFTCTTCQRDFTRKWDLQRHERLRHSNGVSDGWDSADERDSD
ncbi:hypothetical protein HK098_005919 [Nowakowskiella sp. JEL0407]|nr:hypothetical protein HK098_005919 [Nowakowskiella sp. JEL0407]